MSEPYLEIDVDADARRLDVGGRAITIGRHPDNVVPIDDDRASRFHCVIEPTADGFILRDLDSRNGTKVNEAPVQRVVLHHGDIVRIGKTRFRFVDPDAAGVDVQMPAVQAEVEAVRRSPKLHRPASRGEHSEGVTLLGGSDEVDYNALLDGLAPTEGHAVAEAYEGVLRDLSRSPGKPDADRRPVEMIGASGRELRAVDETEDKKPGRKGDTESESRGGVTVLRLLLLAASEVTATDLHVEPRADDFLCRLRVDGTMVDAVTLPKAVAGKLIGVVKVLSDIDIAQRLIVQEGHFSTMLDGRRIDYRVSFTPSMYGQKLVLRILDLANAPQFISDLNLPGWMGEKVKRIGRQDSGMLLVCGPTGSGKTTTLYAVLREVDARQRNVITIEDPVEYHIDGVTQIPIDQQKGNTFGTLLRSVLRQDPDVILLGEIRDHETAAIAMQAAMTGHLLLSTLHAKDSIGTIFRLLDLGVEPYLVASSLNLILAQRLIRQLCPVCRSERRPTPQQTLRMGRFVEGLSQIYYPVGCSKCFETGYAGRRALFELLVMTDDLRDIILKRATISEIRESLRLTMFSTLQQAGYQLVAQGVTSVDEVERVAGVE